MNENAFKAIVTKRAKIQSTQNCTFWHCCCSWWGGTGSQSCTRGRQDFERHVKLRMNRATLDAILANYLIYLSYLYSFHIINEFSKKYYKKFIFLIFFLNFCLAKQEMEGNAFCGKFSFQKGDRFQFFTVQSIFSH